MPGSKKFTDASNLGKWTTVFLFFFLFSWTPLLQNKELFGPLWLMAADLFPKASSFFTWTIPGLFFRLFSSFQTNIAIFTAYKCEKCPSSIRHWDSNPPPLEHETPPLTKARSFLYNILIISSNVNSQYKNKIHT